MKKKIEENLNNYSVSGTSTYNPPVSGMIYTDLRIVEQLESIKQFLALNGYELIKKEEDPKKIDSIETLIEEYVDVEDPAWKGVKCPNLYSDPNNNGEFDVSKVLSILDSEDNTDIHFTKDYCEHCGSMYFKKTDENEHSI